MLAQLVESNQGNGTMSIISPARSYLYKSSPAVLHHNIQEICIAAAYLSNKQKISFSRSHKVQSHINTLDRAFTSEKFLWHTE